ncbi:MAG TPA: hypothetical protein VGK38_13775 [Prolixibacteraceae bacterium]|jgi:hypothetical protein
MFIILSFLLKSIFPSYLNVEKKSLPVSMPAIKINELADANIVIALG